MVQDRPSAQERHPYVVALRKKLLADGTLVEQNGFYSFTKDDRVFSALARLRQLYMVVELMV